MHKPRGTHGDAAGSRRTLARLGLALVWVFAANAAQAEEGTEAPAPVEEEAAAAEPGDGQFLAFLEYLGTWEESDEEWQAFHPDEGLSEIQLPSPQERGVRGQEDGNEDTWDETGRS